jgi:hypothetical protein
LPPSRASSKRSFSLQPFLVLGMDRDAPPAARHDVPQQSLAGNQQRAGRRSHEHLDAAASGELLQPGEAADVLLGGADEEGKIAPGAPVRSPDLVRQVGGRNRRRVGVRHLEDRGDATQDCRPRPAFEVFLVLVAGLAEMHLAVDHAGQYVQAFRLEDGFRRRRRQIANRRDPAVGHADIRVHPAGGGQASAAPNNQIVTFSHCGSTIPLGRVCAAAIWRRAPQT